MTSANLTPEQETFESGLRDGRLLFQRCTKCGHSWLPARAECPSCWRPAATWEEASGFAEVISWVVYHRAYDPAVKDRLPYNVALVRLDEGPQMVTNLVGTGDCQDLIGGERVTLVLQCDGGRMLARFALADAPD
jgi:uncharacterized OB-fold protein